MTAAAEPRAASAPGGGYLGTLALAALGVVYGDIGTSPLYAFKEVFAHGPHGQVPLTPDNIYGVLSLIFWTLTVVVSIKYVVLILRADNNGEGGVFGRENFAQGVQRARADVAINDSQGAKGQGGKAGRAGLVAHEN